MKTTVKLAPDQGLSVEQMRHAEGICCEWKTEGKSLFFCLSPDQAGALLFGIEQALEALEIRKAKAA